MLRIVIMAAIMANDNEQLSERTKKQIDELPKHAQEIFKKAHDNALQEYQDPSKRRNSNESAEEVAHKVAWDAVKNEYKQEGNEWIKK
jgi:cation transport regulator